MSLTFTVTDPIVGYIAPESCTITSPSNSCNVNFVATQAGTAKVAIVASPFQYESATITVR